MFDFKTGQNCWQVREAERIAFLIDGEAYFSAVAEACEAAEETIYIIGWDVDSRIRLRRSATDEHESLGQFLDRLATEKPRLHIYILEWDFAMLYSLERETWPLVSFGWLTHERVHFALDDEHPVGASHHQKIVVVDDRIAFVGGFDLAICRWDTSEHLPEQPKRVDDKVHYGPFHDIQMLVEGDVAAALGQLTRQRWEKATGDLLPEIERQGSAPWPRGVNPDLCDAPVAISRTLPEHDGQPEVREIEQLYLDAIECAQAFIYIENQYLTSHRVGEALENALRKADGPEVLLVLPQSCSGWLEQETMGALRQRLLKRLYAADRYQRLKICCPSRQDFDAEKINVHSKILVVDDSLLTIGSANLSNRSMGFDTECNLALAQDDHEDVAAAISGFRNQLLGEHLGVNGAEVASSLGETGSLIETVNSLNSENRNTENRFLLEIHPGQAPPLARILSADEIVDPERPISIDRLLTLFDVGPEHGSEGKNPFRTRAWRFGSVLAFGLILAALWRWSPLNQWLNIESILSTAEIVRDSSMTVPIVLVIYVLGSCLMFPVTILILATALTFGPLLGFGLALGGSLLGGFAGYLLGHWLGRDVVRKLAGRKLNRLSRKIARRGWLAIAIVRIVPIAPFTIVNMVAGSTHISARSFLIGTAIGMGPGISAIMIFEGGLEQALRDPGWGSVALATAAFCLAVLVLVFGRKWLTGQGEEDDE
jgi:phosphatidylserine/phosphatidylglycerophosphate/cardiolipin synthase-like enzyme/uncharacterized membrane protein YdjX (TVP38/TMEM64 family)